ncbi:hypothetical protein P3X46_029691 [Hevea brasiliensis]|uniref:NAC domain-containing protein n=1 Tax=Hevea brasiliensis TaxID=3981 RepID=A0ABQ9KT13_HEVBR|nr:hypothetical protein P3X46_029691 [Hevea brasiliensis]
MYWVEEEGRVLPCGFRFCPTDTQLLLFYLKKKILGLNDHIDLVPTIDVYASNPYHLPLSEFKYGQPNEYWYFYSNRRRGKILTVDGYYYLSSRRTIFDGKELIGFVRTLDFYHGRPPCGTKSRWSIQEYRINPDKIKVNEDDHTMKEKISKFVVCKIVHKQVYIPSADEVIIEEPEPNSSEDENNLSDGDEHNQSDTVLSQVKGEGSKSSGNDKENLEESEVNSGDDIKKKKKKKKNDTL